MSLDILSLATEWADSSVSKVPTPLQIHPVASVPESEVTGEPEDIRLSLEGFAFDGEIPEGNWHYYLCDMVRPVPVRQMMDFIQKTLRGQAKVRMPVFDDLFLLENYFVLLIDIKVDPRLRRRLSDMFWVKKPIGPRQVREFVTSLKRNDTFFKVGDQVIVPIVHRHRIGTVHMALPKSRYVVLYRHHLNHVDYFFTVNKDDIQVPYSRYREAMHQGGIV